MVTKQTVTALSNFVTRVGRKSLAFTQPYLFRSAHSHFLQPLLIVRFHWKGTVAGTTMNKHTHHWLHPQNRWEIIPRAAHSPRPLSVPHGMKRHLGHGVTSLIGGNGAIWQILQVNEQSGLWRSNSLVHFRDSADLMECKHDHHDREKEAVHLRFHKQ